MSLFDKMFRKNAFDRKLDDTFETLAKNNPVMNKARAMIDENGNKITHTLESELYGEGVVRSEDRSFLDGDSEAIMQNWSSMIDQLVEKEFDAYKVCPSCLEAVSAELDHCPHCGAQLPEHTAAVRICPYCGASNRLLDPKCAGCGKELEPVMPDTSQPFPTP